MDHLVALCLSAVNQTKHLREKRLNNIANSFGPKPGPVSRTPTNSQIGVSSTTGTTFAEPFELGRAQDSSAGGKKDISYLTVIRRVSLAAVNRMAIISSAIRLTAPFDIKFVRT